MLIYRENYKSKFLLPSYAPDPAESLNVSMENIQRQRSKIQTDFIWLVERMDFQAVVVSYLK